MSNILTFKHKATPLKPAAQPAVADFTIQNEGSIYLVHPHNTVAENHLVDHVDENATFHGDALVVEHRYIRDLAEGLLAAGFSVGAH